MVNQGYLKLKNNLYILLAILLPFSSLMSHSVGHDEWSYFLQLYQKSPLSLIQPTYSIIVGLQEMATIPRYLLGFFYLDSLSLISHIPVFWIYLLLFIAPNIILLKYLLEANRSIYLVILAIGVGYFNVYTNFYHLGFLYLLACLHSKRYLRYLFFFIGASLHPVAFIGASLLVFLNFFRRWKLQSFVPLFSLVLVLFSASYYAFFIENKFESSDPVSASASASASASSSASVLKSESLIEEQLKNNLGFEIHERTPLLMRVGFGYNKMIRITAKRLGLFMLIITSFIFLRRINLPIQKLILLIPGAILFIHLTAINAFGQALHGGPGLFLSKFIIDSTLVSYKNVSYTVPPNDALIISTLMGINIDPFQILESDCIYKDRILVSYLPPFLPIINFNAYTSKIESHCLPSDILENNFKPYGVLYSDKSSISSCIQEYIAKYPNKSLKILDVEHDFKFVHYHYLDSPNAIYSDIKNISIEFINCSLRK